MELKIEKGVPLPLSGKSKERKGTASYYFRQMAVGDMIRLPSANVQNSGGTLSHARRACGNDGRKFTARNIDGVLHVWRVK